MTRVAALAVAAVLLTSPLSANCRINLRVEGNGGTAPRLVWDQVIGAADYEVRLRRSDATSESFFTYKTTYDIPKRSTVPVTLQYEVAARLSGGIFSKAVAAESQQACIESVSVELAADEAFRVTMRRAFIPVAGSLPAAGGGMFRTSLEMSRSAGSQRGTLYFRRAGTTPSDSDPSLRYSFDTSQPLYWEDVVAAMGASGVGSIEIVPDADGSATIPLTRVRTFHNDATGSRGSYDAPVMPFESRRAGSLNVLMPPATSRVNVGFRPLRDVTVKALVFGVDQRLRNIRDLGLPANVTSLTAINQLLRDTLLPGEQVTFILPPDVIAFYTVTDNASGDTAVFLAPATRPNLDVGNYEE